MRLRTAPAIAAVLLTAACGTTVHRAAAPAPTGSAPAPTIAATAPSPAASSRAASSAAAGPASNIELSGAAKSLPPGPFHITAVSCGPYTKAQQAAFGTTARAGLVYWYTNATNSVTGAPSLSVDFLSGSTVVGDNVSGDSPDVGPGQKAEGHVDALGQSGQDLVLSSCELMEYGLRGTASGSFAP